MRLSASSGTQWNRLLLPLPLNSQDMPLTTFSKTRGLNGLAPSQTRISPTSHPSLMPRPASITTLTLHHCAPFHDVVHQTPMGYSGGIKTVPLQLLQSTPLVANPNGMPSNISVGPSPKLSAPGHMTFYITPLPNTFGKLQPGIRDGPLNASLLSSLVPPMFQKTPTRCARPSGNDSLSQINLRFSLPNLMTPLPSPYVTSPLSQRQRSLLPYLAHPTNQPRGSAALDTASLDGLSILAQTALSTSSTTLSALVITHGRKP